MLELNKQVVPPALKRESIELQPLDNTSAEKKQDSGMLEYVVSVISGTYDVSVDASELYDYNSVKKASQLIGGDHIIQESSSGDSEKSVLEMLKGIDDETDLDDLDKYLTDLL